MSNVKVAPLPPGEGDKIPMMAPAPDGQISVAALEAAMPKKVAQALQGKVDLNRNGYLDATEIGELFEDLQQSEEKRKMMTLQLIVAVSFLGLSILANLGTAWYAAEAHQTTGTNPSASSSTTKLLTDKDGTPLRTDRSLDEHPMGSLLPDSAFQSLEYLAITGPKGSLRMKVEATARFELLTAQYNSVVVVYTSLGSVEFDGTNMLMTDTTADAFHRAGFQTKKSRRSDTSNPHQRFARDVSKIVGMFGSLSKMELSEFSMATTNANGDPFIPFMNNPFANITEAYVQEETYYKCQAVGTQSSVDCSDGVIGQSLFEFDDAEGNTYSYLKRTKHMVSKMIEGKMMTYAETHMAEYPGARLVDLTGEGSKVSNTYVITDSPTGYDTATQTATHSTFYCDMDDNVTTFQSALPLPAGNNIPAPKKNDGKSVLTYAGNEPFFGVDARKYWSHRAGQDPWAAGTKKIAIYEHALESRPFALAVTPLFQKTWTKIGPAATAPAAFLARANARTSTATIAEFLAGPDDCSKYALQPVAAILTNASMANVGAPATLSYFRSALITPADFKFFEPEATTIGRDRYARMRRSTLLPGEDGIERHRREMKQQYRKSVAGLTKRQKEHVYHASGVALEDTEEGREAFLDHFADSSPVVQFEDPADEEHHRSRRDEPEMKLAELIAAHPDRFRQRQRREEQLPPGVVPAPPSPPLAGQDANADHPWAGHKDGDCTWVDGSGSGTERKLLGEFATKEACEATVRDWHKGANAAEYIQAHISYRKNPSKQVIDEFQAGYRVTSPWSNDGGYSGYNKDTYKLTNKKQCWAIFGMTGKASGKCTQRWPVTEQNACNEEVTRISYSKLCRFKMKPRCIPSDYGYIGHSKIGMTSASTPTPSKGRVDNTMAGFGVCEEMVRKQYGTAANGVTYREETGECIAVSSMIGMKVEPPPYVDSWGLSGGPANYRTCQFAPGGVCSESSSADCLPWGSGGNTHADTMMQCGGEFNKFADCTHINKLCNKGVKVFGIGSDDGPCGEDSYPDGHGAETPGYGWEGYKGPTGRIGNPWMCADTGEVCRTKTLDLKIIELSKKDCWPNPIQYAAVDPGTEKHYMCRDGAMQSIGFEVKKEFPKFFGVCTPSVVGGGTWGKDDSCTQYGKLFIEGRVDCEIDMLGFGISGGGALTFGLEYQPDNGFVQASLAGSVYIKAGDFLTGTLEAEFSEMSFSCCWRRMARFKLAVAFEVELWFLSMSYNTILYNSKIGTLQPNDRTCPTEVLAACVCPT